ncbi:MFS transporter [Staphylospora marina]|uniref:MFS transporter n=1 Tax=Staphylospora marina TaxID=2490858 RepID=UPI0013DE494E|nr:MFS transporter [Staphylospora marina]
MSPASVPGTSGEIAPRPEPGKILLLALSFTAFLVGMEAIVTVPLIPGMSASTGMPLKSGGMLVAAYAISYALFAPVAGMISDRLGRKSVLAAGMGLFTVATALVGFAGSFSELLVFRVLTGIGAGMVQPSVFAVAADAWPEQMRGRVMGIVTGSLVAASVLGIPLGGWLAELGSWRWTFWLLAALIPVAAAGLLTRMPAAAPGTAGRVPLSVMLRDAAADKGVLASLGASALFFGGLQGMYSQSGAVYRLYFDLDVGAISLVLMVAGIGSVLGSLVGGRLADTRGKSRLLVLASLTVSVMILLFALVVDLAVSIWLVLVIQFVWALMYGVGHASLNARIAELRPEARGTVLSLNASAMYVGSASLSFLATWAFESVDLWLAGLLCAVANWGVGWLAARYLRERNPEEQASSESVH